MNETQKTNSETIPQIKKHMEEILKQISKKQQRNKHTSATDVSKKHMFLHMTNFVEG
jgi:hypothetical protein